MNPLDPLVADEINSHIEELDVLRLSLIGAQEKVRRVNMSKLSLVGSTQVAAANGHIRHAHVQLEQAIQQLQKVTP